MLPLTGRFAANAALLFWQRKRTRVSFFLKALHIWLWDTFCSRFWWGMAPQKQGSSGGNHPMGFGPGGKSNGFYQSSSAAMAAAKKPNLQLIQADHELFLQAFESELPFLSSRIFFISVWEFN